MKINPNRNSLKLTHKSDIQDRHCGIDLPNEATLIIGCQGTIRNSSPQGPYYSSFPSSKNIEIAAQPEIPAQGSPHQKSVDTISIDRQETF